MYRILLACILLACAFAACVIAQPPLVYNRAILNGASFAPQGLPSGAVAQGSIFSIFGSNLGPATGVRATTYPLNATLSGTSITITQGNTTVNAIPFYVSAGQINAIMPSNAPLGTAALRVSVNGSKSNAVPVQVTTSAFGIIAANSAGNGPGVLQNFIAADNMPVNEPTIAAQPGQTIILWGTGLGPVAGGDNVPPPVGNLSVKTEVFVGGQPATIAYSGRAPGFAGTDQINFVVPANAPTGCWVPVYVRTNGTKVSNFVTMAIQTNGTSCADTFNPLAKPLISGGKTGAVAVVRETTHEDVGTTAAVDVATDFSIAGFSAFSSTPFAFHPTLSLPPPGACTEYTGTADLLSRGFVALAPPPAGPSLNTGPPPVLKGPGGTYNFTSILKGYQGALIGSSAAGTPVQGNLSLTPGSYTLTGGGGADVGSFTTMLNVPAPITWTNRNQLTLIDRTQPLAISWSGAGPGDVIGVVGIGVDLPTNSATAFACLAQPGASSLTVPPDVLANIPPTEQYVLNSADVIWLVSVPQSAVAAINASGLDTGIALFAYVNGKTVIFQ